jgi:hypothetical protein
MTESTADKLASQATQIAKNSSPLKVLAVVVLGLLSGLAWFIGRVWYFIASTVTFMGLALQYGYRKGAKIPVEKKTK